MARIVLKVTHPLHRAVSGAGPGGEHLQSQHKGDGSGRIGGAKPILAA